MEISSSTNSHTQRQARERERDRESKTEREEEDIENVALIKLLTREISTHTTQSPPKD